MDISVQSLDPDLASQLCVPPDTEGLLITAVAPDGPNAQRLQAVDIVHEVAGKPVASSTGLSMALTEARGRSVVLKRILRGGHPLFIGATRTTS